MTYTVGAMCAGTGAFELGLSTVLPTRVVWHAEIDPGASKVLAARFPEVPNLADLTTVDWACVEPVDVVAAGFPCQPVSNAGNRLGADDDRWIWPSIVCAVRALRPRYVVLENVAAILGRGAAGVCADLAASGYVGSSMCLRASDVGAPHRRDRWFCVATDASRQRHGGPSVGAGAGRVGRLDGPDGGEARQRQRARQEPGDRSGTAPADPKGDGRHQGRPEPAGQWRRSDAAVSGSPPSTDAEHLGLHPPANHPRRRQPNATGGANGDSPEGGGSPPTTGWGDYTAAIRRWEHTLERPAPSPTDDRRRLSPNFVEWMVGLPEGWVTDVPGLSRNAQLKALGNGCVPQQAAAALAYLFAVLNVEEAA